MLCYRFPQMLNDSYITTCEFLRNIYEYQLNIYNVNDC